LRRSLWASFFHGSVSVLILALLAAGPALAQTSPSGKIAGRVTDDRGIALPGVSVEASSPSLLGKAAAVTDENGVFRLMPLPSGLYEIVFAMPGFQSLVRKDVALQMGQTVSLNASLVQAALEEQITVIGQSPLIDVKTTVQSQTMTKEVFLSLPRSRDFDALIVTMPGVQNEPRAGGLSVDGATATENSWYVDGADITDMHVGLRAQSVVMELVEEVHVTTSGYAAEFAGAMGGVVNVVTRSGGNSFRGDIVGFYEDDSRLMRGKARDYLRFSPTEEFVPEYVNEDDLYFDGGRSRDQSRRYDAVFNLGGYVVRDKLWFFASFNPQFSGQKAARSFLSDPELGVQSFRGFRNHWNGQIKLTLAPAKSLRASLSLINNFSRQRGSIPSIAGTGSPSYPYAEVGFDYPNLSGALQLDYTFGNDLLVSARAALAEQNTTNQQVFCPGTKYSFYRTNFIYADDPFFADNPDLLHYNNWTNWTGSSMTVNRRQFRRSSGTVDLTYFLRLGGEHALKAGVRLVRDRENVSEIANHPMVALSWGETFYGLPSGEPVGGAYGYYGVRSSWTSPYGRFWDIRRDTWALYLQDAWTIGGRLTLHAGLRTESEYIPAFTREDQQPGYQTRPIKFGFGDKMAPRLGVVYDVFGDSSLKIFGSFGLYYDLMKLYMAEGAFGGFKWKTDYYELNDPDWTRIADDGDIASRESQEAGNRYAGTVDWHVPNWDATDPGLKPMAEREISLGAEKKLGADLSLAARFVQKHLIRAIEDAGLMTDEGWMYYYVNPGSGYSLRVEHGGRFPDAVWETPKARREYYALNLSLEKRFSHGWQGGLNYTLSRAAGNYGGLSSTDENGRNSPNVTGYFDSWFGPYDLRGNVLRGPLPQDRTHYLKLYGSCRLRFGLTVGLTAFATSGYPLTTTLLINDASMYPNNRADLGRLPFTAWGNIYLEYALPFAGRARASVNLQIDNFTNTKTWQDKVTEVNLFSMYVWDEDIMSGSFDWQAALPDALPNPMFGMYSTRFETWTARLGFRLSF
jgi:Carboxypeptidase regulatory-like domain/TonB dependent receptor-like, beta-barrel